MPVQACYIVRTDKVCVKEDIRVYGVYPALEPIVESSLASATGQDLGLDDQLVCACGRRIYSV